jgi:hypothetical protein
MMDGTLPLDGFRPETLAAIDVVERANPLAVYGGATFNIIPKAGVTSSPRRMLPLKMWFGSC